MLHTLILGATLCAAMYLMAGGWRRLTRVALVCVLLSGAMYLGQDIGYLQGQAAAYRAMTPPAAPERTP